MKNKKGEGYVSTCVMIVVICMNRIMEEQQKAKRSRDDGAR